jgi:hypothetical protein
MRLHMTSIIPLTLAVALLVVGSMFKSAEACQFFGTIICGVGLGIHCMNIVTVRREERDRGELRSRALGKAVLKTPHRSTFNTIFG